MVIHDAAYATPPETFHELTLRLQHLAEERVGKRLRRAVSDEDDAVRAMEDALHGPH